MSRNESLISVPPNVEEPVVLRRFLIRVVEQVDLITGARGQDSYVSAEEVAALVKLLNDSIKEADELLKKLYSSISDTIIERTIIIDKDLVEIRELIAALTVRVTDLEARIDQAELDIYNLELEVDAIIIRLDAIELRLDAIELRLDTIENTLIPARIRMLGEWAPGAYVPNDQVTDGPWTMYCINATEDRAGIYPTGDPFFVYQGTMGTNAAVAKQVVFGQRYTFSNRGGFTLSYRIDVVVGNHYSIYSVSNGAITPLISFVAASTEQVHNQVGLQIVKQGTTFDLVCEVDEPAATPTTQTIAYNYQRPGTPTTPTAGQITHSNTERDKMEVHKTDDDGTDQSAFLANLTVGDILSLPDLSWAIQKVTDNGTYLTLIVAPAARSAFSGRQDFVFETRTPTAITYPVDVDYWLGNANIRGLFVIDGGVSDLVENDNAYGLNIEVQEADVSANWGLVAYSKV